VDENSDPTFTMPVEKSISGDDGAQIELPLRKVGSR
jgi:hypothetical protein